MANSNDFPGVSVGNVANHILAACENVKRFDLPTRDRTEGRKIVAKVRQKMINARRFYMDEEVVRAAARMGIAFPEVLQSMFTKARLPFETVWMEWPLQPQMEEAQSEMADDAPRHASCLLERLDPVRPVYRLTEISHLTREGPDFGKVSVVPWSIEFDLEQQIAPSVFDQADASNNEYSLENNVLMSRLLLRRSLLGSAAVKLTDETEEEYKFRLANLDHLSFHGRYVWSPLVGKYWQDLLRQDNKSVVQEAIRYSVAEGGGMWRFIISVLVLLNSQEFVSTTHHQPSTKTRRVLTTTVPFLDHYIVSLKLPRHVVEERLIRSLSESIPKRRHEVMGHWAHRKNSGSSQCSHAFRPTSEVGEKCMLCGYHRWWINEHYRGDASIGFVTKDRLLEKRRD